MALPLRQPIIASAKDRSFWLQDVAADAVTQPLAGDHRTDIVIVGGGFTGLWTALRLREQAHETRVTILEADICGSGASGRNGGQVHSWFAELDQISAVVGKAEGRQLCADTVDAIKELEQLQRRREVHGLAEGLAFLHVAQCLVERPLHRLARVAQEVEHRLPQLRLVGAHRRVRLDQPVRGRRSPTLVGW